MRGAAMTIKQKGAEGRGTLAPYENVLKEQHNTTSSAVSISFILPIDGRYRLTADEYAWRIEKRKGKRWIAIQWHSDIETAVHSLAQRMIRTSEVQTLADALVAVENVSVTLTHALAPHFRVERRS
jgi:hypothetical protein